MELVLPDGQSKPVKTLSAIVALDGGIAVEFSLPDLPAVHSVIVRRTSSLAESQRLLAELVGPLMSVQEL